MSDVIKDGTGQGFLAKINKDNQLVTRATAVEQRLKSASDGNYFEATTGKVTLANTTETGIIYLKNTNTSGLILVIDRVFWDFFTSTDGTGADGTLIYYKNPTITGGTDIVPNNTNFSSTKSALGDFKKSLTAISGTAWWTAYITDKQSIALDEGRIVLGVNDTFGISISAPTGNTSMVVAVNVAFYYLDAELLD